MSSRRAIVSQNTIENYIFVLNSRGFELTLGSGKKEVDDVTIAFAMICNSLSRFGNIAMELSGWALYLILATFTTIALEDHVKEFAAYLESNHRCIAITVPRPSTLTPLDARVLGKRRALGAQYQRQFAKSIGLWISCIRPPFKLKKSDFVHSTGSDPYGCSIPLLSDVFLISYAGHSRPKRANIGEKTGKITC